LGHLVHNLVCYLNLTQPRSPCGLSHTLKAYAEYHAEINNISKGDAELALDPASLVGSLRALCIAKDAAQGIKGTARYAVHNVELHPELRKQLVLLGWRAPKWDLAKEEDALRGKLLAAGVRCAFFNWKLHSRRVIEFTLEGAAMHVINGIPLGCSLSYRFTL
jgi:hypothetical protein